MKPIQLSKNLVLHSIERRTDAHGRMMGTSLTFFFFGQECSATIFGKRWHEENPNIGSAEADEEIFDSFNEALDNNWDAIRAAVDNYMATYSEYPTSIPKP